VEDGRHSGGGGGLPASFQDLDEGKGVSWRALKAVGASRLLFKL